MAVITLFYVYRTWYILHRKIGVIERLYGRAAAGRKFKASDQTADVSRYRAAMPVHWRSVKASGEYKALEDSLKFILRP